MFEHIEKETHRLSRPECDADYTEYENFVELRQQLVDFLESNPEIAKQEKRRIHTLAPYETGLLSKMESHKQEAQAGMRKVDETRRQRNAYYNDSYGGIEGFMFDKRR
ncbi:hypothetical protein [Cohnella thailandensis]|uniref:Flagellar protein FliT n=1 Tax=Cohnella thailandensis TaxID=557557 RepID=A0A841SPQ9_9BACL|nr:hypothetical protein [Cohnella thailandensis]MBB6632586.1 hypothetical protein [Cohnella thailandensis]MBP1971880.1 hypothetical protein [Cohnella thailandensis]